MVVVVPSRGRCCWCRRRCVRCRVFSAGVRAQKAKVKAAEGGYQVGLGNSEGQSILYSSRTKINTLEPKNSKLKG